MSDTFMSEMTHFSCATFLLEPGEFSPLGLWVSVYRARKAALPQERKINTHILQQTPHNTSHLCNSHPQGIPIDMLPQFSSTSYVQIPALPLSSCVIWGK